MKEKSAYERSKASLIRCLDDRILEYENRLEDLKNSGMPTSKEDRKMWLDKVIHAQGMLVLWRELRANAPDPVGELILIEEHPIACEEISIQPDIPFAQSFGTSINYEALASTMAGR